MGIMSRSLWASRISNLWIGALRKSRKKRTAVQRTTEMERLEDRTLLAAAHPLFAPGTSPEYVEEVEEAMGHEPAEARVNNTWATTATNGGGNSIGDPVTVTWSLVPDGSLLDPDSDSNPNSENPQNRANSDLITRLGQIYGVTTNDSDYTDEAWFPHFQSVFDRWEAVSGINFVYEPNDDGQAHSYGATGQIGVRGDIRIGGTNIDGNSGVLAYNYYPNGGGDMVIDTADSFYENLQGNSLRLRNVVAHEVGHGIGFAHVLTDVDKLMNPYINLGIDGPQFDDILAVNRAYGDNYEASSGVGDPSGNETTGDATDLGTFGDGDSLTIGSDATTAFITPNQTDFVSIDDDSDSDVFEFTVSDNSTVSITLTSVGPTYQEGPQSGGSQEELNASEQSDLTLELIDSNGSTVLQTSNSAGLGGVESITGVDLSTAGTYFIRVTGTADATQFYTLNTSVSVETNPTLLSITTNDSDKAEGDSGATVFLFTVNRSGDTTGTSSVQYTVETDGNNTANADDLTGVLTGTINFEEDETSKVVAVSVQGDTDVEDDETFTVTLSNPVDAGITTASVGGIIRNDDRTVSIAAESASKNEGTGGTTDFTFRVTRSGDVTGVETVVDYAIVHGTTNDADFGSVTPGQVTFAAGETARTVTVQVNADADVEDSEEFSVSITAADNASIGTASAAGAIINDDSDISVAATDASKAEGDSGNTAFTFTISRDGDISQDATVTYTVSGADVDAADFGGTLPTGTATIPAGQSSVTVTINVSGDNDVEPDETFTVTLSNSSAGSDIVGATANGTILNDDVDIFVSIAATDANKDEGDSGTTPFTFTVTRVGDSSAATSVNFEVTGGDADADDFGGTLPSGIATIAADESTAVITINVAGDLVVEGDESFTVEISEAVNGEITGATATGTIVNDDQTVSIAATDANKEEGNSGTTPFLFTLTRTGDTSAAADVDYAVDLGNSTADAADFATPINGTVTFEAGTTSKVVAVFVNGDLDAEADETFTVVLSNPTGNLQVGTDSATGTIVDDDTVGGGDLSISAADAVNAEGDSGDVTVLTFEVTRTGVTSGEASADYVIAGSGPNAADADDFVSITGTVTFADGETSKTIEVEVQGDDDLEANEGFTVTLQNPSRGVNLVDDSADGEILNDDGGIVLTEDGTLIVTGTAGADYINVFRSRGNVIVRHYEYATRTWTGASFPLADVNALLIQALDGWNYVRVANSISLDATIEGGADQDIIYSGRGNDTITTFAGNDVVVDSRGNDVINTGDGNDYVSAGRGHDLVNLGDGADRAHGGHGNDTIFGEAGNDRIYGDNGHDMLVGGDGDDVLRGGNGHDILFGGAGADYLSGERGNDLLLAGTSNYDTHLSSLQAIQGEWTARSRFSTKVTNVTTGGGSLAGTGIKLDSTTVQDDGDVDRAFDRSGRNLLFVDLDGADGDDDLVSRSRRNTIVQI